MGLAGLPNPDTLVPATVGAVLARALIQSGAISAESLESSMEAIFHKLQGSGLGPSEAQMALRYMSELMK